jgi:hypothetical protein
VCQFFEQRTGGESAHVLQRLPDGGEARNDVGGSLDVVEAKDGDIFRHLQTGIVKRSYGSDCGDVVEAEDSGEVSAAKQELVDAGIAKLRGGEIAV